MAENNNLGTRRTVHIDSLRPSPENPNIHSDEQIDAIADSMRRWGFTQEMIVVEQPGEPDAWKILAGHGRRLGAIKAGIDDIPVNDVTHVPEAERPALMVSDNKLASMAETDDPKLAAIFEDMNTNGVPLEHSGFDIEEANEVMKAQRSTPGESDGNGGQTGEDEFGEVVQNPVSRIGDTWLLGPHRLVCGDCMDNDVIEKLIDGEQVHLVATDPPYAIYGSSTGMASDIADDKMVVPFFERVLQLARDVLPWFGHAYVFCDWRSWPAIHGASKITAHMEPKNLLMWDKGGAGLGTNYVMSYECIGFFHKLPKQTAMGDRKSGVKLVYKPNVLRHPRPRGDDRQHNAAKPVALMRDLIDNSSGPGDVVLEPFAGSGTTIIAADQTERVCLATEIDPGWCDVILTRFWKLREDEPMLQPPDPNMDAIPYSQVMEKRNGK